MFIAEGAAYLLLDSGGRVVQIHQHYVLKDWSLPPVIPRCDGWVKEWNKQGILYRINA